MFTFFIYIIHSVFIENGEFINNKLFVILILGIFISLNLINLLNNSEKYGLFVNGLFSFSIVLLIFQNIPSNYVIGGLGKVEGGIIIQKEDILNYYNNVKYSKNNLNNDRDKSEKQTFFNPNEIYYSKVLDIYFTNFMLLFEDSKYYYGSLDYNQGVVCDTIKIKKDKYTFKEGIFNTEYDGDNINIITTGYNITGIYGNILNSHSYNLTHIYETVLREHLSQITLVDDKISDEARKKLFIELESLYLLNKDTIINNESFIDLFNDAKDIFKGNDKNLDKINQKLGEDQKISNVKYFTGNYSSDLLNSGLDKNYGYFLELIVLLSNKLNNKLFVNDTGKKYHIKSTFQDLEECLYYNKCSEGKFNFDETGSFSKQNLKSRYGFILQGFKSWGNKYDLQLLKYISGENKVEKY